MNEKNCVVDAVRILGGPTRTAILLEVSNASVHYLMRVGKVSNSVLALKLEAFTAERGQRISAWDLAGLQRPKKARPVSHKSRSSQRRKAA
jgi:hypothetical protein